MMAEGKCRKISSSMFVRFLYLCYVIGVILIRIYVLEDAHDWTNWHNILMVSLLGLGIPAMITEALYLAISRRGKELKWFTPNVLFFLLAAVPSMVNMQWHLDKHAECAANTTFEAKNETEPVQNVWIFSVDELTVLFVQLAVVLLVLGKWIAPKGGLSRSEHAQLLFVLLCAGADIVDFIGIELEGSKKDIGCTMRHLIMAVAGWSSIQFCFVPTAVKKLNEIKQYTSYGDLESNVSTITDCEKRNPDRYVPTPTYRRKSNCCNFFCFYNDIWGVLVSVIFLDLPFFVVRGLLMFGRYMNFDSTNVFFTFKNFFSILLTINRVWVVTKNEYTPWKEKMRRSSRPNI